MQERKAVYYGQVELIPGIISDGYVLDDDTAVMSERGTANLLGVDQKHLNRVRTNSVEVVAKNSPHKGREITIYDSSIIENLIRFYILAFANNKLRKNQKHIGERCAILSASLIKTALDAAIKE